MILLAERIKNRGMEVSGQKMAFDPATMLGSLRSQDRLYRFWPRPLVRFETDFY
jgi:hypothetical protein